MLHACARLTSLHSRLSTKWRNDEHTWIPKFSHQERKFFFFFFADLSREAWHSNQRVKQRTTPPYASRCTLMEGANLAYKRYFALFSYFLFSSFFFVHLTLLIFFLFISSIIFSLSSFLLKKKFTNNFPYLPVDFCL